MGLKLSQEEQETHLWFDVLKKCWFADTTYPPHWRELERKGWVCVSTTLYPDGTIESKRFTSGNKKGVSFTNPTKTREMTEEQREAARLRFQQYHAQKKAENDNVEDNEDDLTEEDFLDED